MSYLSEMGHPVSSFEHNLLEKFAKFVEASEAKGDVAEEIPAVEEAPAGEKVEVAGINATEDK